MHYYIYYATRIVNAHCLMCDIMYTITCIYILYLCLTGLKKIPQFSVDKNVRCHVLIKYFEVLINIRILFIEDN